MPQPIPIALQAPQEVVIESELVARALGLSVAAFRQLMDDRKITVLCERGTGEHAGLYRATFYHENKRVRLVVDGDGRMAEGAPR